MDETSFQVLELDLHSTTFKRDQWRVCRAMTVQGNREAIISPTIAHTQPQSLKTVLFVGRESSASALAVSSRLHKKCHGIFYLRPSEAEGTLFHLKAALCWAVLQAWGDSSPVAGVLTHRLLPHCRAPVKIYCLVRQLILRAEEEKGKPRLVSLLSSFTSSLGSDNTREHLLDP